MHLKTKLNYLNITGIIMILLSILIFTSKFLDTAILNLTYIFLEGSSEGKSVLLFGLMGSILILYPLFRPEGTIMQKFSSWSPFFHDNSQKYLKLTIILIVFTYVLGSIIEVVIRMKLGVSPFTTFVAMNPSPATTSITHSHVFKSVLGDLISFSGLYVPANIHTGTALIQYTSPLSFLVLISFPLTYLFGLISLNQRKDLYKIILAFAVTTSLIGMLDGGMFSTPALVGLSLLLGVYAIKKPFSPRNLIKPSVVIILIVILRLSIGIMGSNTDYHDITILDEKNPIDLNGYNITKIDVEGNKTILRTSTDLTDKTILADIVNRSEGKADGIFISWDIFTWVSSDTSVNEP